MAQRNFVEWGIFPANMHPVRVPSVAWNADPTLGIIVNEAWIPYISGALKVMLRDAMWDNPDGSIFPTIQQADDMLSSWRAVVDPGAETDWQINCICQSAAPTVARQVSGIPGVVGNYGWRTGVYYAQNNSIAGSAMDMHITFGDLPTNAPVGVNVYDFEVSAAFGYDVLDVVATDCLGTTHVAVIAGTVTAADLFGSGVPIAIKSIDIFCDTNDLQAFVRGADPIQCSLG